MSVTNSRNSRQKREIRRKLCSKYGNKCQICNENKPLESLTIDHIVPLARGGNWNIGNLQLACGPCNQRKSDDYADPWAIFDI